LLQKLATLTYWSLQEVEAEAAVKHHQGLEAAAVVVALAELLIRQSHCLLLLIP
jgi:uncharacterized membrane protein YwzB